MHIWFLIQWFYLSSHQIPSSLLPSRFSVPSMYTHVHRLSPLTLSPTPAHTHTALYTNVLYCIVLSDPLTIFCNPDPAPPPLSLSLTHSPLHTHTPSDPLALSSNPSVRSNALFILGDLCVRYTNLVDRHIGVLAACLQVRMHTYVIYLIFWNLGSESISMQYTMFITHYIEIITPFRFSYFWNTSLKAPPYFLLMFVPYLLPLTDALVPRIAYHYIFTYNS